MGTRAAYLAMTLLALALALAPAAAARAQGLVITPLPSQQVIEALTPPLPDAGAPPVQPAQTDPGRGAPLRAGLPRPSIIIGDRAVLAAFDPRGPLGFAFESRQAIRQRDAALFERLLGNGAFDPDAARLAEAIQTELRRMACYGGSIDGAWGAGSAGAVRRWSQTTQAQAGDGDSPDMGLYRAILRRDDVECQAPAVAAPAQPATVPRAAAARAAPARDNRSAPAAARAAPARSQTRKPPPAASAPAPSSRQINPSLMGSGLFR